MIHPDMAIAFWLVPMLTTLFYITVVIFFIYVGVRVLKFIKRKEERDQQINEKLNHIIERLDRH